MLLPLPAGRMPSLLLNELPAVGDGVREEEVDILIVRSVIKKQRTSSLSGRMGGGGGMRWFLMRWRRSVMAGEERRRYFSI